MTNLSRVILQRPSLAEFNDDVSHTERANSLPWNG